MAVRYVRWGAADEVSYPWYVFLACAKQDGWPGDLTEGHRSMARQRHFRDLYEGNPSLYPIAAIPSPTAPHIRSGRADHASDVTFSDWLIAYGRRHGVRLVRTVRWPDGSVRELWHLEVQDVGQLSAFARKHAWRVEPLGFMAADERRWISEYVRLKRAGKNVDRRRVLLRQMAKRRKEIHQAALKHGWHHRNRRKRWALLRRYTAVLST